MPVVPCRSGQGRIALEARTTRISLSEPSSRTTCPVNPTGGCIACHMPAVKNVVPHSSFTDHFIRVHQDGALAKEQPPGS